LLASQQISPSLQSFDVLLNGEMLVPDAQQVHLEPSRIPGAIRVGMFAQLYWMILFVCLPLQNVTKLIEKEETNAVFVTLSNDSKTQ
jgi:hypothetical protein